MRAAVVQMASGPDVAMNLATAAELLSQAATQGAQLAVLPENFAHLGLLESDKQAVAEPEGSGPLQDFLAEQSRQHDLWLVGGSMPIRSGNLAKVYAACLVYNPAGQCMARYDKLHLFDVGLPDSEENYCESASYLPGKQLQLVDTELGRLGLSICYDLRFPELYRHLSEQGAEFFTVPSAFTRATGKAHWEVLLRARAIENLAYVLAANQGGEHPGGRQTFGSSMIVDPWGAVLARIDAGVGVAVVDIDLDHVRAIRQRFPALSHRRISTSTEALND